MNKGKDEEETVGRKKDYLAYRRSRAKQTLEEAQFIADGGYYNTAINRLYYAAYYEIIALLLKNKINASTHSGVRSMFSLHFIRTGKLPLEHGQTFVILFDNRQTGDYEDFNIHDESLFELLYPKTKALIEDIEKIFEEEADSE